MVEGRLFFSSRSEGPWRLESLKEGGSPQPVSFRQPLDEGALGPSILKTDDGYLMGFAVSFSKGLRFAKSGSLNGPWDILEGTYLPRHPWEGGRIDFGSGSFVEEGTANFFYSSLFPSRGQLASRLLRHPMVPTSRNLRRLVRRRIGVLGFDLKTHKVLTNPTPLDIESDEGTVSESLFCPGYLRLESKRFLFPAGSNYSMGYPYRQAILCCEGSPPNNWSKPTVLIDDKDLPTGGPASFDWADPKPNNDGTVTLYFSAAPRTTARWSIFRCQLGEH